MPTELHIVGVDGGGQSLIYTSQPLAAIVSLAWAGDDIVFVATPSRGTQRRLEDRFERLFPGR